MDKSKHEYWREILSSHSVSNQPVSTFCSANSIPAWKFYYWRKRLSPAKSGFEEVSLRPRVNSDSGIELSMGSLQIKVSNDFDESTLRRVLSVLSC